jgi:cytoskeletal protein CcmA (bactofilin family)
MANKILLLLTIGLFIHGRAQSQHWGSSIKGEGKVVTQEIQLEPIHGFSLSFDGDVTVTQGSTQKIVIEGQQNIIDNIKREVKHGYWNIEFDKNVKDAENVKVTITLPSLDEIGLCGSGSIMSTNRFKGLNDLELSISGSGDLHFNFEAKNTEFNLSGSGKSTLEGATGSLEINISGSGDVTAKDLEASDCEISISGSGDASVNVNGDLKTAISGSGDVTYKGNASVNASISGSGNIRKM